MPEAVPRVPRDTSVTFRVDYDVLTWARARAFFGGLSLNAVIRRFLEEYAAVPPRWMARLPPPWTPENRIRLVMDPIAAGHEAAGRTALGRPSDVVDSAIAEVLWVEADPDEPLRRQG
ncbi:MAG: hypothetical protein H0W81_05175 [Chloroflexi bacterium]|nr:hypothetical protein [Chloroflexota bacterium]